MNYQEAIAFLSGYANYERELRYPYDGWAMNLARVRLLLDELGAPDRRLPAVHVVGAKGKGSVAAMIESIARAGGVRTGLYTSPHLIDFRERIRIGGEPIGRESLATVVERLVPAVAKVKARRELGPVTYFELLTAIAFAAFAEAKVELAVLEAGLGARYDATTVCDPLVSVITPISFDHTDILGDTLEKIAVEKSFAIKPGRPVVIAPQPAEAMAVFKLTAAEAGAELVRAQDRYSFRLLYRDPTGQRANFTGRRRLDDVFMPLIGDHQLQNAAVAIAVIDLLDAAGLRLDDHAVRTGLGAVRWPGRFQRVAERPDLILDGAHNAASAACLAATTASVYPGRRIFAVVGMGGDKDAEGFARELIPALAAVIVTRSRAMKALTADRVRAAFGRSGLELFETDSVAAALDRALALAGPEDVVLVTGSFYVIAEALEWLGRDVE